MIEDDTTFEVYRAEIGNIQLDATRLSILVLVSFGFVKLRGFGPHSYRLDKLQNVQRASCNLVMRSGL